MDVKIAAPMRQHLTIALERVIMRHQVLKPGRPKQSGFLAKFASGRLKDIFTRRRRPAGDLQRHVGEIRLTKGQESPV